MAFSSTLLSPRSSPWRLAEGRDEGSMWLAWLVRLRWVAIIGQVVTLSFTVGVLDQPAVLVPVMLGLVGLLALSNAAAVRTLHRHDTVPQETLLMHLLLDVGVLTAFFLMAGGAHNPFITLYMIHIAMAAVMMRPIHAAVLIAVVILANALLHFVYLPLHYDRHSLPPAALEGLGQTVAFTATAISVGLFILGMSTTLRRQKQRLLEARDRTARTDRLRAVGTLAAGAAHELNTPLSTVGLRLRRVTRRHKDEPDTARDLEVIKSQVDRCAQIVEQLLIGAGDPSASGFERAPLQAFVSDAIKLWSKGSTVDVELSLDADPVPVELPKVAFTQAFINLLENAREAQLEVANIEPLRVEVVREGREGVVRIWDHGPGLPDTPDRVGEPFFTTKATGTGLGVFVARSLADGAGGGLGYDRVDGRTLTRWHFPETARTP